MWPVVSRAIDFVLTMQLDGGEIAWARSDAGIIQEALLTGCASIYHSIRCALALANYVDEPQPEWEVAVGQPRPRDRRASRVLHCQGHSLDGVVLPGARRSGAR